MISDIDSGEVFEALSYDKSRARKILNRLAKAGEPDAMFLLGRLNWESRTQAAFERGFSWFKKAAELDHPYATCYTGIAYFNGIGVRRNRRTGLNRLKTSASAGCIAAMLTLAEEYMDGKEIKADWDTGIDYLKQAAAHHGLNDAEYKDFPDCENYRDFIRINEGMSVTAAQEWLAVLYEAGNQGLSENLEESAKWLAKVYANGVLDHAWSLVELYEKLGTPETAKPVLLDLVKRGDPKAMHDLGVMYEKSSLKEEQHQSYNLKIQARQAGFTGPGNTPAAPMKRRTITGGYLSDDPEALFDKALSYLDKTPPEYLQAVRILYKAHDEGHPDAQQRLIDIREVLGDFEFAKLIPPALNLLPGFFAAHDDTL